MAVAGVLGLGLTALAARRIGVDQVASNIIDSDLKWVLIACILMVAAMFARAASWIAITRAALPRYDVRRRDVTSATMIGVLMSATLPARLGEPARAMVLSRHVGRMRETFPVLIGTLVSQTALNILALVLLGGIIVSTTDLFQASTQKLFLVSTAPLLVLLAVLMAPSLVKVNGQGRIARAIKAVRGALQQARKGLTVFRDPRKGSFAAGAQLFAWFLQLLACWALFAALGLDHQVAIGAAAACLFAVNVTAVVPATPSNIGIFQLAIISVLQQGLRRAGGRRARLWCDPAGSRDRDGGHAGRSGPGPRGRDLVGYAPPCDVRCPRRASRAPARPRETGKPSGSPPSFRPRWSLRENCAVATNALCPVLIRREAELAAVEDALLAARRGESRFVALAGEAGIGKTRLASELTREARELGCTVLAGACSDAELALPYLPFVEAIGNFLDDADRDQLAEALGPGTAELGQLFPQLARGDAPERSADPGQAKLRLFEAIVSLLALPAREHTLLFVIEDVHWADASTRELLDYLARRLTDLPSLILVTLRSDEMKPPSSTPAGAPGLASLGRGRSRRARTALLQRHPRDARRDPRRGHVDPELHELMLERSEGNPFVLEEMLREAVEGSRGRGSDGGDLTTAPLPETVRHAILLRVQRLGDDQVRILETAAILGRSFDAQALLAVSGEPEVGRPRRHRSRDRPAAARGGPASSWSISLAARAHTGGDLRGDRHATEAGDPLAGRRRDGRSPINTGSRPRRSPTWCGAVRGGGPHLRAQR